MTKLPSNTPLMLDSLTKEQFDAEISKGIADIDNGRVCSSDEIELLLTSGQATAT